MSRLPWILLLFAAPSWAQTTRITDVFSSSHNFVPGGRSPVTTTDDRACIFCHVSHSGSTSTGYLWNQRQSSAAYTPYQSPTLTASPGNPAAGLASRLCLSCHDGTVAPGQSVAIGTIPTFGSMTSDDITGLDFRRHHPVGIRPIDDGQIYSGLAQTPATSANSNVKLPNNLVECVTCHDPHSEFIDPARGKFLVVTNQGGALCLACHDPGRASPNLLNGWTGSAHQIAANSRSGLYGTVGADACQSCHYPHNTQVAIPLLRAPEEAACSPCHAGSGTSPVLLSVMSQFGSSYSHPATTLSGMHVANENTFPLNSSRHAECPDCHNPHSARVTSVSSTPPAVGPPLAGVSGVDGASGQTALRPAANEYEVCFKCHGYSANRPQRSSAYAQFGYMPWRLSDSTAADPNNAVLEFNGSSRHNVTQGRQLSSAQVPSLRAAVIRLNGSSGRSLGSGYLFCTDCHNNPQARTDGGAQAAGVHGSSFPHILERRYDTEQPPATPGGNTAGVGYQSGLTGSYALCYKCHDLDGSVLQNRSFREHSKHISGARTSCSTCHDSHGIGSSVPGSATRLVNFDTRIVGRSSSGLLRFEQTGTNQGRCYLTCHGKNHNPLSY